MNRPNVISKLKKRLLVKRIVYSLNQTQRVSRVNHTRTKNKHKISTKQTDCSSELVIYGVQSNHPSQSNPTEYPNPIPPSPTE